MSDSGASLAGGYALSPAAVGGRRRSHKHKLRLVKKKTVRRMLKKMGLKMRGGVESGVPGEVPPAAPGGQTAGRRRRRSHKWSIFRR